MSENEKKEMPEDENVSAETCGKQECGCDKKDGKKDCKKEDRKLKEENEKLTSSLSELTDKYQRMLAEYDNFRKRAAKERDGIYTDAASDVLNEILPIKDSLEMAMAYADDGKLSQGVTMTLNKFAEVLKKLGVEEFGAKGDKFDPNLHNAIFHIDDESFGESEIVDVMLKGYRKGEKIIRYAMVKVAN